MGRCFNSAPCVCSSPALVKNIQTSLGYGPALSAAFQVQHLKEAVCANLKRNNITTTMDSKQLNTVQWEHLHIAIGLCRKFERLILFRW